MTDVEARPSANHVTAAPWDRRLSYPAWVGLFVIFALPGLVLAYEAAMHFNEPPFDGPFQLYNALRRIAEGFRPGVDFQYFHGLGVPYSHYWLYRLLGGGLEGSELARDMVTAVAYPTVFLLFFRAFVGDWRRAFCLAATALALSFALTLSAVIFASNAMLGVRSALPTLIPVLVFAIRTRRTRVLVVGVALGVALFMSTEQGLAAVAAYLVVSAIATLRRSDRLAQLAEHGVTVAVAAATLVACLVAVGGVAGMHGALRYNFRDVPLDQYWYFGVPPNAFVGSWTDGIRMLASERSIGAAVLLATVAAVVYLRRLWLTSSGDDDRRSFALALLAVYGVISLASLLGVFTASYTQPCWRVLLIIALLEWTSISQRADARVSHRGWLGVPRGVAMAALVTAGLTVVSVRRVTTGLRRLPHVLIDHVVGDKQFALQGSWPATARDAQRAIDAHRGPTGDLPTLWSTYAGWPEARNRMFHPSFDYIIHALGPENRLAYLEKFRAVRPQLVQTVLPTVTRYEPWIANTSWEFYAEVLHWYTVTAATPWSIFWERRDIPTPLPTAIGTMTVPVGTESIHLPAIPDSLRSPVTLLEVDVEYEIHNPLRWLPIVGAIPRYMIGIEGALSTLPVSLDPYVRRTRFPVLVDRRQATVTLHFRTFSLLPGASFVPRVVHAAITSVDPRNQQWLTSLTR